MQPQVEQFSLPRWLRNLSAADYRTVGRTAVGRWFVRMTGHGPAEATSLALMMDRRIPKKVVRLWIQDDLFPEAELEIAARAAWPELGREFRDLDRRRRDAHAKEHIEMVRRAVDEALGV